ncbi:DUF1345 domain-containing protein [Xanthobacter sp. DSM 24535]|uniref:DUF1345 domain-containing protein n=1 Tax=Roseixanthobacter psychrophilus TaxID=3119917 RepID=UPI003728464D
MVRSRNSTRAADARREAEALARERADQIAQLWVGHRVVRLHARLFIAIVLGALAFAAMGVVGVSQVITRALLAWDIAIFVWLVLVGILVVRTDAQLLSIHAGIDDEGGPVILVASLLCAGISLAAVIMESGHHGTNSGSSPLRVTLAVSTLLLSWLFLHTIYALHYSREFYSARPDASPMLVFPGDARPTYWDLLYFSFNIGTASQTADVTIPSPRLRRLVLGHQIASYIFNAAVIALGVNVAASLV